ncbi:MAG: hypothetical protein GY816_03710, partial [Cytophagales bacterium]|nr:hypothetical protein [Cytophagales bacterium]
PLATQICYITRRQLKTFQKQCRKTDFYHNIIDISNKNIIGGDFNLRHPQWGSHRSSGTDANDFVSQLGFHDLFILNPKNSPPTHIHKSCQAKTRIDLTLATTGLNCTKWRVLELDYDRNFSDHIPITYSLELAPKYGFDDDRCGWNLTNSKKWRKFRKELDTNLTDIKWEDNPHKHAAQITNIITGTATDTIGVKYYYNGHKPWWTRTCAKACKKFKMLSRKINRMKKRLTARSLPTDS